MAKQGEELLTEAEVARWLRVSVSSLKRLRLSGEGPPSINVSKRAIRYKRADVEEWLRQRAQEGS
jgi:predicted DNA-binding transcriptional regulator AlpA